MTADKSDLVERLEYRAAHLGDEVAADAHEEIVSLRAELAGCRACRAKVDCLSRDGTEP